MLEFLTSGFFSLWLNTTEIQTLKSTNLSKWLTSSPIAFTFEPEVAPDPAAVAAVRLHLAAMAEAGMPVTQQGVWVQIGNQVVAEHLGRTPLSAASLTKIATTAAALTTWGTEHQFTTLVGGTAPVQNGVLQGDLVVQGSGDPLFVWEESIALANALQQAGINRITGNLVIAGDFIMNFETDPRQAGSLLKQGMNAALWNAEAAAQFATMPQGTRRPALAIDGDVEVVSIAEAQSRTRTLLIRHQSLPLSQILKAMNSFSNNAIAEVLAAQVGGSRAVAQKAAEVAGVPIDEIQLINGSGLGNENRISPRAVGAMLIAIQRDLQPQMNVGDLFSVSGQNWGVARNRSIPLGSAIKTGTLNDVSSLAGVIPTRDKGLVWFAIINVGAGNLQGLHDQQDLLLQRLQQQWGAAAAPPDQIRPGTRNEAYEQLGAPSRNQVLQ